LFGSAAYLLKADILLILRMPLAPYTPHACRDLPDCCVHTVALVITPTIALLMLSLLPAMPLPL
jgi:hypothetical protein